MPAVLAPRMWLGHLLVVAAVVAATLLGLWQLDAWQARRADEARDLTRSEPVALTDVMGPDDPFPGQSVGQPVDLSGTWLPEGTVFVSGRAHEGQDGYWMVTPLAVGAPDAPALPVVLGWVADPDTAPPPPQGQEQVVGWLQPPEGTGERDPDPDDDVVPQLRVADVVQRVDQDLYSAYAISREGIDGLPAADLAQLPAVGRFTAVRNLFYAVEWWVFGAFAVFIWWRWVGDELVAARAREDEPADGSEQPDTVRT